jgi:uncharacterized NAD-dependent epimerase/dehydratase family protein
MNGRRIRPDEAADLGKAIEDEMQLPVVDVIRQGPERLVAAVDDFRRLGTWRKSGLATNQSQMS